MFQFKCDFEEYFCGARSLDSTRSLNPALQTFSAWLDRNKQLIPLEYRVVPPHRFLFASLILVAAVPALAADTERSGPPQANGISIHYAIYGQGSPVIFVHGGLANTDYWGNQVPSVAAHHTVISDGQPRSWPQHPRRAALRL